ncbi:MAG: hypothetical protein C0592_08550 [Marinilabiliales bacterium]|nr:MAG: hypothetical protein C0592_08550 [Marinilabiliales bacterium]
MKTQISKFRQSLLAIVLIMSAAFSMAQEKIAVLNIHTNVPGYTSETMGNLVRTQLIKNSDFAVVDRWDLNTIITEKKINPDCNNTMCLTEIGKIIGVDKMLSGSVEVYGRNSIMISMRIIDVKTGVPVNSNVIEYIYNINEIPAMIEVSILDILRKPVDPDTKRKLTDKNDFASSRNSRSSRLNASGPRIGLTYLTGSQADRFSAPLQEGGFDGYPAMFQFGYQFEVQYLNEGSFQALFEFVPMITGLDQGRFIPSFTLMNGLRNNRSGWEFAFGPTILLNQMADGYYVDGNWHLASEWDYDSIPENPNFIYSRLDSRGSYTLTSGFVFAFGKTFKSGNLNIPVNLYVIPSKEGMRFGASFGYNSRNR